MTSHSFLQEKFMLNEKQALFVINPFSDDFVIDRPVVNSVLLDSHVVSYLDQGLFKKNDDRYFAICDFAKSVISLGWEFDYIFYYVEALSKSHKIDLTYGLSEQILQFEFIDKELLFNDNIISLSEEKIKLSMSQYKVNTFAGLHRAKCNEKLKGISVSEFAAWVKKVELLLLKMVLINFEFRQSKPFKKMKLFCEFMMAEMGTLFLRETILAAMYFSSSIESGFVPYLQENSNMKKIKKKIASSAWDMTLLRWPEFGAYHDGTFTQARIVTAEKVLKVIVQAYQIEAIEVDDDGLTKLEPSLEINLPFISANTDEDVLQYCDYFLLNEGYKELRKSLPWDIRTHFYKLRKELNRNLDNICK